MQKFKTHGKWILAGEHSVLRGCTALVFPVRSRFLNFQWDETDLPFQVQLESTNSNLELAFWGVLEKAIHQLGLKKEELKGHLYLDSNIPVGAGMGASATLCVSLARWFHAMGHIEQSEQYNFAKSLEDLFHGQSSGVDVAVALLNKPLLFKKPDFMEAFEPQWAPHIYLSYCGKPGVTSDCIRKVNTFIEKKPQRGHELDVQMQMAVDISKEAFKTPGDIDSLRKSIDLANACFSEWELISQELENHMGELKKLGAIATKPTGSGDGGFVLSLWKEKVDLDQIPLPLIEA